MSDAFYAEMTRYGSFPKGERHQPYQEYYYKGRWVHAEREIVNRSKLMGFNPKDGELVVEIGCQTGGFMQYAWLQGARKVVGIDYDEDYIRLAKKINVVNGFDIQYMVGSANDQGLIDKLKEIGQIDHLLLMSMGKHIGTDQLFHIIDSLNPKKTYLETNAVNAKNPTPYLKEVSERGGSIVCKTVDRNDRVVYVIPGKEL